MLGSLVVSSKPHGWHGVPQWTGTRGMWRGPAPTLLLNAPLSSTLPAGKYHDALVADIRGSTAAYSRWNLLAEWFGYIKNQLYAPLFPHNQALRIKTGDATSKGTAAPVASVTAASS